MDYRNFKYFHVSWIKKKKKMLKKQKIERFNEGGNYTR